MRDKTKSLLGLMFDEDEEICVSDSQFSNHSLPLQTVLGDKVTLMSPNEKVSTKEIDTDELIFVALNPIKGFRKDSNCYKFRNFLIELDVSDRMSQIGYIKHLKVPYSAMVWSGSKSTHTLISLQEDLPDEKTYRLLYKWALNIVNLADQALGNPSRCIRLSGAIRPETGREQELVELRERIPLSTFMAWLNRFPHLRPQVKPKKERLTGEPNFDRLSPWCRAMLSKGIDFRNGRNQTWFGLAVDFALAGYTEEQTIEMLGQKFEEERDFKEKEWLVTIGSAFKYVSEGRN